MASSPGSSDALAARVRDPGYTPGIRDLDGLLDLFGEEDEELARATERAVLRIEPRHAARVVTQIIARLDAATRPARGRLARLVGRVPASAPEARAAPKHAAGSSAPSTTPIPRRGTRPRERSAS